MSEEASCAIYYDPDGFETSRERLMGRHVAGEEFLRAMARHASPGPMTAAVANDAHYRHFERKVREASGGERPAARLPLDQPERLMRVGCLFFPAPIDSRWAWIRRRYDQRSLSLCGVTHTTASGRTMHALGDLLTAPIQSWDAVVCTSQAVFAMVDRLLESFGEYLRERFDARTIVRPQLPVIPLGVDCEALAPGEAARARGLELRRRHGIASDARVVLFVGRLSYHGKAHPLPLFAALERAAGTPGPQVVLLMAGWFANDGIEDEFRRAAHAWCPSVDVCFADGRHPDVRADVWHAADLFVSPADNVQETFGLAPAEAMAAGLPCVLSDWDGYRDHLVDGDHGLEVPTWLPPEGAGRELALRYQLRADDYDHYIARVSQFAAVDVAAMAEAVESLLGNPDRMREMGGRGRERALAEFDWRVVIGRYEELFSELAARRACDAESAPARSGAPAAPLNDDPFGLFCQYASHTLCGDTRVRLAPGAGADAMEALLRFRMNTLARTSMPSPERCAATLRRLGDGCAHRVADLQRDLAAGDAPAYLRGVVWLAKMGLVELSNAR